MQQLKEAMLSLLKDSSVQAEIQKPKDLFEFGDNLCKHDDKGVISAAAFIFSGHDELTDYARPLVLLDDPSRNLLSEIVREYFLRNPDAEAIRQEVLRIYHSRAQGSSGSKYCIPRAVY